ncbi:tRNA (guanosine(46)-N7)-methyltransferase TrmB [Celeribacter ethanolicus]|uniref:tRNA (guanosine(46)-N7)-methyltransferase TrmB n=1 Tax=Celeribacter ethanolicus TaxID=1758178 RepID=UPI00083603DB|nr:tRNA (guanosine(46)-N7)-methyltransferase TrmB [Celeribacter ethanolicus]
MSDDQQHQSGAPWRNFYGRIHGKTLNKAQVDYLDEDLPDLAPGGVSWEENPERVKIDMAKRFAGKPVWVEIGFGGGEHLVHMARSYPDVYIIGCEPFVNGVAMCLGKMRREGPFDNIAIHAGDARDLFDVLPDGSIEKAFLNYPDPWPKKRHHRRRFVTDEHLDPLHRVLKDGAEFRVATDIPDYVRQTMEEVPRAGFEWLAEGPEDWRKPWSDWISTRYEQKAIREGRTPHYMTFKKV